MNLKRLLKTQLLPLPKWILNTLLVVALIGFADATYLTVEHFANTIPPCSIGGCEIVLTSAYSEILGIPVSLFGAIFYLLIAISLFVYRDTQKSIFLVMPLMASALGFVASVSLIFVMMFVLKAFCPYCLVSAITSTTIFVIACGVYKKYRYLSS